jgi:hydroxypyruvate isomerase
VALRGRTPASSEVDDFVRAIDDAGVLLSGLNLFAGDMSAGERGILSSPTRGREFADNVPSHTTFGRSDRLSRVQRAITATV